MKVTAIIGPLGTVTKGLVKGTWGLGNKRTSGNDPNYSFIKIGQNTEKCPEEMSRLVVTQTQVRNHQLTLVPKNPKRLIMIMQN